MSGSSSLTGAPHSIPAPKVFNFVEFHKLSRFQVTGAATGGQQLSATANQFVDKIDPFSKRGNSRRRRRPVNSSRYHAENEPDLVQLPLIKGRFITMKLSHRRDFRYVEQRTNFRRNPKATAMSKDFRLLRSGGAAQKQRGFPSSLCFVYLSVV
jgi:hypothetical protein